MKMLKRHKIHAHAIAFYKRYVKGYNGAHQQNRRFVRAKMPVSDNKTK